MMEFLSIIFLIIITIKLNFIIILINHQKLSDVFINETAQKQYVMGLYINNKAPNNLIKEVTNNYQRMGVGLEELNISSTEVIKKIEELFEDKIDEIKRP